MIHDPWCKFTICIVYLSLYWKARYIKYIFGIIPIHRNFWCISRFLSHPDYDFSGYFILYLHFSHEQKTDLNSIRDSRSPSRFPCKGRDHTDASMNREPTIEDGYDHQDNHSDFKLICCHLSGHHHRECEYGDREYRDRERYRDDHRKQHHLRTDDRHGIPASACMDVCQRIDQVQQRNGV